MPFTSDPAKRDTIVTADAGGHIIQWSSVDGAQKHKFKSGEANQIFGMDIRSDGLRIASGGTDTVVRCDCG